MNVYRNDWLTVSGNKIGIEIGIGHQLGNALNEPVMILKSSIGNRALGWDLLPPGSRQYEFDIPDSSGNNTTYVFPGYKGSPEKWVKGTEPVPIGWYAGLQYDADTRNAKTILSELDKYYPGATNYEVAGFLWWQGDRDSRSPAHTAMYEKNLVQLIKSLRTDFNAPNAAFVTASLGQSLENDSTSNHGKILQAMKSAASDKYQQELGDNIGFVYTNPLSKGGTSGGHYNGNAQTYMNVGLAMGKEMIKQLEGDTADPNSAIEIWRKETFTPNEAAISGNAADPDKDGIKNIIEYAIGTDPKVKNTTDAIQLEKTGNTITLTYNKNNNATDIDLSVEYSFGLESSSWNLLSTNPVITPTPGNVDQMKATITVPSSEKTRFYRLKASMK